MICFPSRIMCPITKLLYVSIKITTNWLANTQLQKTLCTLLQSEGKWSFMANGSPQQVFSPPWPQHFSVLFQLMLHNYFGQWWQQPWAWPRVTIWPVTLNLGLADICHSDWQTQWIDGFWWFQNVTEDSVGTGNYLSSDKSSSTCAKRQLLGTYQ